MLTSFARIFGVVFILVGVMGFVPSLAPNEMLLGIFHVNAAHNIVHILSGVVALAVSSSTQGSKAYFQIFGLVYGLVAILGFFIPHGYIFGLISNNPADTALHIGISVVSLYLGFVHSKKLA